MPKRDKPKREIETHRWFMWPTSDDWYPNFPRNTVRVSISSQVTGANAFARMSVWGADDCGMEQDRRCSTAELLGVLAELGKLADQLPNPLTKQWLREHGFVSA